MNNINDRIKELRKTLGLNQEDFGKKILLVKSGISNMENGSRPVNDKNIKLICQEYNVNESWLRTGEGEMFNQRKMSLLELLGEKINSLSDIEEKALYEFLKLPDEQRKFALEFLRKLVGKD